jgi:hypothetical protein
MICVLRTLSSGGDWRCAAGTAGARCKWRLPKLVLAKQPAALRTDRRSSAS